MLGEITATEMSRMNVVFNIEDKYILYYIETSIRWWGEQRI